MFIKAFRFKLIVRIILIIATICLFAYLLLNDHLPALIFFTGAAILYQISGLIKLTEQTNRDLTRFFQAIRHADFSQSFSASSTDKSFGELRTELGEIINKYKKLRTEREEQNRYLQTVIQHVGIGILAFRSDGKVEMLNKTAKRLLHVGHLKHIETLHATQPALHDALIELKNGEKRLMKVMFNDIASQLTLFATDFLIAGNAIKLVTLQDIQSELDEKEMEAWQNLIRVLTHEIMNSITPISSLAGTASSLLPQSNGHQLSSDALEDVRQSLATIQKRSTALLHFVDTYRSLTRLPRPKFKIVAVKSLFHEIEHLYRDAFANEKITLHSNIVPTSLEITADPELISQVLINLVLNAKQALSGNPQAQVELNAFLDSGGRVTLEVCDNGPGIQTKNIEKIFIPFFTTKKTGSGIGLSLCRQIMRMHKGTITVHSEPDVKTAFKLRF